MLLSVILFMIAQGAGFWLSDIVAGTKTSGPGLMSPIVLSFGSSGFHLHHWIMGLMVAAACLFLAVPKQSFFRRHRSTFVLVLGFAMGLVVQSFYRYSDWASIIIRP